MITMQALINNQTSLAARREKAHVDTRKPIAVHIEKSIHPLRRIKIHEKSINPIQLLMTLYYRNNQKKNEQMVITDYISKNGLLVISLGMLGTSRKNIQDILSLDDASIHSFLCIIINHWIGFDPFNIKQPLGVQLGHGIIKDHKYRIVDSQWYGGNLNNIQELGNRSQQRLYYDGANTIDFRLLIYR